MLDLKLIPQHQHNASFQPRMSLSSKTEREVLTWAAASCKHSFFRTSKQ